MNMLEAATAVGHKEVAEVRVDLRGGDHVEVDPKGLHTKMSATLRHRTDRKRETACENECDTEQIERLKEREKKESESESAKASASESESVFVYSV